MVMISRFAIILFSFACCCHLKEQFSSYFTFSNGEKLRKYSHNIVELHADSELACALRCSRVEKCDEAIFHKASKKCSWYQNDPSSQVPHLGENIEVKKTRALTITKVFIPAKKKRKYGCENKGNKNTGRNRTTWASCHDIMQKNGSKVTGHYHIRTGKAVWKTRCRMNGIPGCGNGVWALVMRINGSRKNFLYDSNHWTSQASAEKGTEVKNPGYWLSNFTKICITMEFTARSYSKNAAILVNYKEQSLYTALEKGLKMTWHVGHNATSNTPHGINKNCLIQGFNMIGPHPWNIKARIGVESQPVHWYHLPYLVRGVGISFSFRSKSQISCGDVIIRGQSKTDTRPAFCRIYIQ